MSPMFTTTRRAALFVLGALTALVVAVLLSAAPANAIPPQDPNGPPPSPAPTTYTPPASTAPVDRHAGAGRADEPAPAHPGSTTTSTIVAIGGAAAVVVPGLLGAVMLFRRPKARRAVPPAPTARPVRQPVRMPVYRDTRVLAVPPAR
ncbi:hypothetical protein [Jatrophihabitans fulvus]